MEIRDPIYGFIPISDWEKEIINSAAFQRLRKIQQLALTSYIYPSATHTRFEHSLGVMNLVSMMYDSIRKNGEKILKDELSYENDGLNKDRQLIRFAALLHDIGHAPYSHASEEILPISNKTGKPYKHEDYSISIIKYLKPLIEQNSKNINYDITAEAVADLIEGDPKKLGKKIFWKELISSQLDGDRGDYLLRDSHHAGVKYGVYDYKRLLNTLTIGIDPETKEPTLVVDYGGFHVAESVIVARYQMFTQVYFHHTRRAYDYHLKEAIKAVLPSNLLPSPDNVEDFLKYDDYLIWDLINKNNENEDCYAVLNRKHMRRLYETQELIDKEEEILKDVKRSDELEKIEKYKKILADNNIKYYEDESKTDWYKLQGKEIKILKRDDNKIYPLSDLSAIAKNLGKLYQIRLFVNLNDIQKAKELLK